MKQLINLQKKKKNKMKLKLLILISVLFFTEAFAISVKKLSLSEMSTKSSWIIHAKCEKIEVKKGEFNLTYTYTTFKIIKNIKGQYDTNTIVLRSFGDYRNNKIEQILGYTKFDINNEYVLFLKKKDKFGYPILLGVNQGSYKIIKKY
jgi:hypothetical protein